MSPLSSPVRAVLLGAACLAGCSVPPPPIYRPGLEKARVTRVSLRPEDGRLRSSNFMVISGNIAPGSPVQITSYSEEEVRLRVNGVPYVMLPMPPEREVYFPIDDVGIDNFIDKLFADSLDALGFERLEPDVREAVLGGKPMIGMTKEQVFMCLGPPMEIDDGIVTLPLPRSEVLASDVWTYPYQDVVVDATRARIYFEDGKLVKQEL